MRCSVAGAFGDTREVYRIVTQSMKVETIGGLAYEQIVARVCFSRVVGASRCRWVCSMAGCGYSRWLLKA